MPSGLHIPVCIDRRAFLKEVLRGGGLFLTFLSGCTLPSTFLMLQRDIQDLASKRRNLNDQRFRDLRGVVHLHTYLSHDSQGSFEEIFQAAQQAELHFIVTTDHNNPKIFEEGPVGRRGNLLILRGAEIGIEGSYLLVFPLERYIDTEGLSLQGVVDAVHEQKGLAIAAHAGTFGNWDLAGLDGMEIYDLYDNAVENRWRYPGLLIDILSSYDRFPDEVFLSILRRPKEALRTWDRLSGRQRLIGIGTPDAHQNLRVLGKQIDFYSRSLRFVNLHLLSTQWRQAEIVEALREGRCYTSFDLLADPTGFNFSISRGGKVYPMGSELPFQEGFRLHVQLPLTAQISLFKNGKSIRTDMGNTLTYEMNSAGVYRVECMLWLTKRWWPWIFSNPIYLRGGGIL